MGLYQGRALERAAARRRRRAARPWPVRLAIGLAALAALALVCAHVPWRWVRERVAVVGRVRVEGARYLDPARVCAAAGLHAGDDLLALDLARARQALLLDPRVAAARVSYAWPRDVRVRIVEREPLLLVRHGVPWEVDSAGVLLPPLARGVVADVPLLTGPDFSRWPGGTRVLTPGVRRGLAWVRALGARELQLAGQVSELDVADPRTTGILLMSGTRVLAPAWPPGPRVLSALRVVLADLEKRGLPAREVDLRFENQVVVRPADGPDGTAQNASTDGGRGSG
ncbi:MAG TPA: FtsQ-type POTRA domain-containing protein [Terriglobales bacterium]|nr:FtsQ-type POTRA domain-containing protein [Terriglobales bacterium]